MFLANSLLLSAIVPAGLVMLTGVWIRSWTGETQTRRWLLFLMSAAIIVLSPLAIYARHLRTGELFWLLQLLPALQGVLALILVNGRTVYRLWRAEKTLFSSLFLTMGLLFVSLAWGDPFLLIGLTAPSLVAAGLWTTGRRLNVAGLGLLSGGVLLGLLLEAAGLLDNRQLITRPGQSIAGLAGLILAFTLAALLLDKKVKVETVEQPGRGRWLPLMAGLLLVAVSAVVVRLGVLIKATGRAAEDHLPLLQVMAAIIIGMLLVGAGSGRSKKAGLLFISLVPALIAGAYTLGWQFEPQAITQARAERLTQAVEQYRADHGAYPSSLASLTPTYLTFIPKPLTGRDQIWCYQGGPDYYRLGYVYYQRYYDPTFPDPYAEIKIHAAAGQPPPGSWVCDRELERVELTGGL